MNQDTVAISDHMAYGICSLGNLGFFFFFFSSILLVDEDSGREYLKL